MAGAAALVALTATAVSIAPALPGGDEPHYLVITQSLLLDGDLKIENNHAARDYVAYHPSDLQPHFMRRGRDGQIYSIHAPGVPVLVAPAFALFGYRGAQATVMLLASATAGLVWWLGWLATGNRSSAWFAWAAIVGSTTFLVQGVTIFPDGPGAFASAVAAVSIVTLARSGQARAVSILGVSVALTAMPFFHSRFAALAGLLGTLVLWQIVRRRPQPGQSRALRVALFVAPAAIGFVAWIGYFIWVYGRADPRIPYGNTEGFSWSFTPGGAVGLLFDQQYGLFAYSPVLVLAVVGALARSAAMSRWLFAVAFAYCALATTYWMWWAGGPAPPARLAAAVLPLLAGPVAICWQRSGDVGRRFLAALVAVSVATTGVVLFAERDLLFLNFRTARAVWLDWFGSVADLPRMWPSFFWRLDPARLETEWPFVLSAVVWLGAAAVLALLLWRLSTLSGSDARVPAAVAALWWLPLTVTIAGAVTARVDSSPALRPAVAQVAMLARASAGRRLRRIEPGRFGPTGARGLDMQIMVPRVEVPGSARPEWLALTDVPAGRYDVRVRVKRPRGGTLSLFAGESPEPFARLTLAPRTVQDLVIDLAAPVETLRFEADQTLAELAESIELVARSFSVGGS